MIIAGDVTVSSVSSYHTTDVSSQILPVIEHTMAIPTLCSVSTLEAQTHLNRFFNTHHSFSHNALLVEGPPGSGKTTLVREAAHRHHVVLRTVSSTQLSDNNAGIVESNIIAAFTSLDDSPTFVFIDNLDFWVPRNASSSSQFRLIATLNDLLSSLADLQTSVRPRFIATASSRRSIHPSLLREACMSHIISLTALCHAERLTWCQNALALIFPDSNVTQCGEHLASITPGFVHSDMLRFFSRLVHLRRKASSLFPRTPSLLLSSPLLRQLCAICSPSLLSHVNPLLTSTISKDSSPCLPLLGLDDQVSHLTSYLDAILNAHGSNVQQTGHLPKPTGIVVHGPTGCGKSALVRQLTRCLPHSAVNVLPVDSASIVSTVIGEAERNLTTLFTVARAIAPTVIIFDNIDVIAPARNRLAYAQTSSSAQSFNRLLSTLLVQIDGIRRGESLRGPLLIMATTRSLDLVDAALLRAGRLDIHVPVALPDAKTRLNILYAYWKMLEFSSPTQSISDHEDFKSRSDGWTCADVIAYGREMILENVDTT